MTAPFPYEAFCGEWGERFHIPVYQSILLLKVSAGQAPVFRIAAFTPEAGVITPEKGGRRGFSPASPDSGSGFKTKML